MLPGDFSSAVPLYLHELDHAVYAPEFGNPESESRFMLHLRNELKTYGTYGNWQPPILKYDFTPDFEEGDKR